MTIKRTAKYLAAVTTARQLGLSVAVRHSSADEVYSQIESSGYYWDSKSGKWQERASVDPLRELDRSLVRVRVSAHLDTLESCATRLMQCLQQSGFTLYEASKIYPNLRDADGGGRIYLTLKDDE